jgi:nicotinate-nucleotide adenylyltransferase
MGRRARILGLMADQVSPGVLGILGGTFDPIHLGHLALAREARRALDLESVLLVPNADPPHKGDEVTPSLHRAAMVALAIADDPGLMLSDLELERPGPSYAVDTVAAVAARSLAEGRAEPWFILSIETLLDLPTWRQPERIAALARIAVGSRPGTPRPARAWLAQRFPGQEERFTFLDGPHVDIAATDVRERLRNGDSVAGLVPERVDRYIEEHGLYAPSPAEPSAGVLAPGRPGGP